MRVNSAGETTWDNVWNLVSAAALLFAADAQLCMFLPLSAGACWKWSERMNVWLRVRETQVNHRSTEAERQRALLNTTLQWARSLHTRAHKLLTHNTSSPFSCRTQRKEQERRERQTRSERESEGEGVREERRGEERESCGLLERTAWLQIRDWLRCFCGLYHYRVLARREAAATKVSGLLWTDDVK